VRRVASPGRRGVSFFFGVREGQEPAFQASNPKIVREITSERLSIAKDLSRLVRSRASYAESHPKW